MGIYLNAADIYVKLEKADISALDYFMEMEDSLRENKLTDFRIKNVDGWAKAHIFEYDEDQIEECEIDNFTLMYKYV